MNTCHTSWNSFPTFRLPPNLRLLLWAHPILGGQTRSICSNGCHFFEQLRLGGIDWHHTFMMPCSKSQSSLTFLRCISTIISTATSIAISTEGAKATLLITFPEAILTDVHQRLGSYSGGGGRGHRGTGRFAAVLMLNRRDALVVPGVEMHRPSTFLGKKIQESTEFARLKYMRVVQKLSRFGTDVKCQTKNQDLTCSTTPIFTLSPYRLHPTWGPLISSCLQQALPAPQKSQKPDFFPHS